MENFKYQRVVIVFWAFFWVCVLDTINNSRVEGKQIIPEKYRNLKHKGTIKTIVSIEDDDVIDCVDFYQQPAFDDPRIKSLKVEFDPISDESEMTDDEPYLYQNWRKYGECPNGTIPIRRSLDHGNYKKERLPNETGLQSAGVIHSTSEYLGVRANLSLWNPKVANSEEFSASHVSIISEIDDIETIHLETIQAGWTVAPGRYDSNEETRFFIYWKSITSYGCYDVACPGFVQVDKRFVVGGALSPMSVYKGQGSYVRVAIYKSKKYGNWWLSFNGKQIGFWPSVIFDHLRYYASMVKMGGEVMGQHTHTEMGSGHFAKEGRYKASYVGNIQVRDYDLNWVVPKTDLKKDVTNPGCYSVMLATPDRVFGTYFYFGGPGGSATTCK